MIGPELGLPTAFDVSDLLGDASLHLAHGQQLRAPRAGPAAGSPAARRACDRRAARWRRSCASSAGSAPSRARSPAAASPTRARSRPDCVLALFEVEFADGAQRALPAALPRRRRRREGHRAGRPAARARAAGRPAARCSASRRRPARSSSSSPAVLPGEDALEQVRSVGGEQSNSSVVFGERCILKAYRRLEAGESPELEMLRFLDAHGFEHAPRLLGWYGYDEPARSPRRSASCRSSRPARATAGRTRWTHSPTPAQFLSRLRRLGEVTARMHGVLASDAADPAFAPEEPRPVVRGRRPAPGWPAAPEPIRARSAEAARAPARAPPRRHRRPGDPPARRLPPRPGAVGPRRLARARLRGRARAAAGRAPPQEHAAARRRGHAALVRLRGRDGPHAAERLAPRTGSATRAPRSWAATATRSTTRSCRPQASRARRCSRPASWRRRSTSCATSWTTGPTGCTCRSRASCACSALQIGSGTTRA